MTTDNTVAPMTTTGAPDTTTGGPELTTGGESTGGGPTFVEGLARPESILHDVEGDVYLISSINGDPGVEDDNGFISRVLPDGTIDSLNWIDGAAMDVVLSAPKGMAIVKTPDGDVLYVADLNQVHKFDRATGAPIASIPIGGAMFLNDVVASPIGRVYVSDTVTNSIHFIDADDTVTTMLATPELDGPNGLLYTGDFLIAVAFNSADLFQIGFEGPAANIGATFDFDSLDGIVAVADGLLVSSWDEETPGVYHVTPDLMTVTPVVEGIASPADIEVDLERNVLLVPNMLMDRAEFYPL